MTPSLSLTLKWSVEFDNTAQTAGEIRSAGADIVSQALQAAMEMAQSLAPVLTGTLVASIHWEMTGEQEGELVVDAYYGVYVEYGTTFSMAQPFFTPAMQYVIDEFPVRSANRFAQVTGAVDVGFI